EPAARRAPLSDAGLELALLYQRLGRQGDASRLLNMMYQRPADDAASLRRAARAAQALADQDAGGGTRQLIQDANALYRSATRLSDDPLVETAWGNLFL